VPERANKVKDIMSRGKWTALVMAPHLHANHPFFLGEKNFINAFVQVENGDIPMLEIEI
jgi:hypothetical protein